MELRQLQQTLDPTLFALLAILVVGLFGLAISVLLRRLLLRAARRGQQRLVVRLIERFGAPSRLLFPLIGVAILLPFLHLPPEIRPAIGSTLYILFVLDITWFLLRLFSTTERFLLQRYVISVSDNLRARRMHTQVRVIRRILTALVILIAAASALTTFETVRQLGTALLASAGILGIILGFAVVAIWDRRRMVLPVSYREACVLQVTNATEKTMELRASLDGDAPETTRPEES